jgi:lipid-binding SYLF domain-containing protein
MSLLRLGQVLGGNLGKYVITRQIQETVWFAEYVLHSGRAAE